MSQKIDKRGLVLYFFLFAILASIWLAMVQLDRQWQFIAQTQEKLDNQTKDIAEIRRQIGRNGIAMSPAAQASGESAAVPDAWRGFSRAQAVTQNSDYAQGDWLVRSFPSQVPSLSPFLAGDTYSTEVREWVFDSLITQDPESLEWLPLVAESWKTSDDGRKISFDVRQGVSFSDGVPLTADDVQFSWQFLTDERIAIPAARGYYSRITDVTIDGSRVTFHFEEPYFLSFLLAGSMPIFAKHFYGKYLESVEAAEQYNNSTGLLLGSGPYRMASPTDWKPGDLVELVRNERYWGWVTPSFDRRIWKTISSDAAQLTEFKNGGVDVYAAQPLEYRDLLENQSVADRTDSYEYFSPVGGYIFIGWNNNSADGDSPFRDRRVREAMTYLTDRQRLVDEVLFGHAKIANGPFNPFGPQANPNLPTRPFDPEKAKALLNQAGFSDRDGDGVLESAEGKPFSFKLSYPAGSDSYKRFALQLKDMYVRAGILMEPEPTDWPVLMDRLDNKTFDAVTLGFSGDLEVDVFELLHSSQSEPGGNNIVSYKNPELDALLVAARTEMDIEKRMPLWHKIHEFVWKEQPYTYLYRNKSLIFIDKRIKNAKVEKATGLNIGGRLAVPTEWYVPAVEQKYRK